MSKVRINDLARELEVKSRPILDALEAIGVTGKTHSSSIEADQAERVREYFKNGGKSGTATKPAGDTKPKFDLSKVSKPGDALKAILERKHAEAVAKAAPPRPTAVVAPPASVPAASAAAPKVAAAPVAPPVSLPQGAPAPRRIVPQPRPQANIVVPAAAPAIASKPPVGPVIARPPVAVATTTAAPVAPPPAAKPAPPAAPPIEAAAPAAPAPAPIASPAATVPSVVESPAAAAEAPPETPAPAVPPVRRVIMPQTGPRPIYTAPPAAPGVPQRGRPIFERPRPQSPGAPGSRPMSSSAPGARRPMHPTRTFPGGPSGPGGAPGRPGFTPGARPGFPARPGFGARPGGAAAGAPGVMPGPGEKPGMRPAARPASRRGGQRYEKTKEGPMKGFQPPPRYGGQQISNEPLPITRTITVTEGISVKDLAEKLDVRGKDLIATLLMKGVFVTVNQSLEGELVKDVARQFGADATIITVEEQLENEAIEGFLEDTTGMVEVVRSPVVTVMGHVDHGKTSLLDAIRSTDVAGGEAGGITQHIGAYKVKITKPDSPAFGREIVFLDTPGHEAFTRMRARGAKVTDIVVIVVAADDGVMPQTLEAIDHARAANVPIIVAVNKIDKPEANPSKVIQQLTARGLQPSNMGGDTEFVEVSAKKHINLDKLEEMICLVADVNEQKAQPDRPAVGTVIEAKLDRGRGAVASILVQNGTLRTGDSYIVGNTFGKIRAMFDDRGRPITEAGPSTPVEILGLEGMPDAGDTFLVMADRDKAKGIAQYRKMKEREAQLAKSSRVSLEGLAEQIKQAGMKDLNLILKGDVQGSVEVLADSLQRMSTEKVRVRVLHSGVGAITESDVLLASASNAVVIGFNVRPDRKAAEVAERENVEIRLHSIIYELQDEITKAMYGLLEPVFKENYAGRAEVLNVFKITKVGQIAGCRVTDGLIRRDQQVRLLREGAEVWKGKIASLKRFKDDVSEVRQGVECGIDLAGHKDIRVGDVIESFTTETLAAELGQNSAAARKAEKAEKERAAAAAAAAAENPEASENSASA
jgi:translation initiation factor IF-2